MSEERKKCQIPNTHKRLLDAHRLWHQAEDNYFDPDAFRTYLNATIQTLRNLTFALQSEKSNIPEFSTWYSDWQQEMRKDPVLKWLNAARVTIVHKGDLETKSVAKIKLQSYFDLAETEFNIEPNFTDQEIFYYLSNQIFLKLPKDILDDLVIEIERCWIVEEFPDTEVLDSLAYVFQFMFKLVIDAHIQTKCNIESCKIIDNLHEVKINDLNKKAECMIPLKEFRIKHLALSDLKERKLSSKKISLNTGIKKQVTQRYEFSSKIINVKFSNEHPFEYVEMLIKQAKNVLLTDGYHESVILLFKDDYPIGIYNIRPEDHTDKYLLWRKIASEVEQLQADALISINEAWMTQVNIEQKFASIESDIKNEALLVTVITKNGHCRNYITRFKRKHNKIKFNSTTIDRGKHNFIVPVLKVWEKSLT